VEQWQHIEEEGYVEEHVQEVHEEEQGEEDVGEVEERQGDSEDIEESFWIETLGKNSCRQQVRSR
jgi:hypothetical protein